VSAWLLWHLRHGRGSPTDRQIQRSWLGLDIPLGQNQTSGCSAGREKKILHLYIPDIPGVSNFEQAFRIAKAYGQRGEETNRDRGCVCS
jgi:hypothetical protein